MADLTTCLTIGGFSPEDAAEIRAFVRAAKGDQAAGIQAYLDSLQSDVADLAKQIDAKVNPGGPKKLAPVSIPRTLYQPAYHGTPHQFDKFSLDHIGTGEGAQAYGWGLYFAGRKGVAEHYRKQLAGDKKVAEINGEKLPGSAPGVHDIRLSDQEWDIIAEAKNKAGVNLRESWIERGVGREAYIVKLRGLSGGVDAAYNMALNKVFGEQQRSMTLADKEDVRAFTRGVYDNLPKMRTVDSGRLFKVEVPEDSELLVFDARLVNQPEAVQEKLAAIGFKVPDGAQERRDAIVNEMEAKSKDRDKSNRMVDEPGWHALSKERDALDLTLSLSGKAIYEMLAFKNGRGDDRSAGDKAASLALRDAGIPGHRYLDGGSRADGDGSYNYVIYDEAAVSVLEFEQQKRGSIVFPSGGLENGKTVINLFETADLSTFLHETSHAFLEMFTALASTPDAPQQMQDDLATIRKWLGNDGGPYSVEQHEKYARGGEAYFMSGEAPSLALADAFSRFKAWLTRIYKTALGLNVKITPEIRDVMDRMLATDAEIAAARQEQEMRPLFSKAPPGMADGDFATYQRMARRASEQAEQRLLEKTMEKVRREKESWFREEKKAVYAEVSSEFDRQPRYRLIDMLANQKWIGGDQKVSDMQIDRKMLVEQFGDGVLAEVSPQRLGGKRAIYGDSGSSPEEAAQFFGFGSASEMVSVLQNTQRKKGAIAQEVDRRMTERHGDPLTDGTIEREALEAIHNEQQANTAVSEARHMAKQLGRSASGMTVKLYRQRARLMVGRMAVKDVVRPERFLASERKAARAAQDAFAKVAKGGKNSEAAMAAALQAKEQQILNGFLYNEARAVAAEVQKGREKMRAYDKKSVREKLEGGYIEQIDAILSDYDFRVRGQGQINRAESLNAFVERMIAEGREGDLAIDARLMDEAGRKHYTRLSVDELRGLFDTIDNIDHMGRFKQKLIDRKRARDLRESVDSVSGQIRTNMGDGKAGTKNRITSAFNLLWRTDTLLVKMDGGEEIGASYDQIKRDIDEATSVEQEMHVALAENLDALFKAHYSAKDISGMKVARDIAGGNGRPWSKMEILAVALNLGNEDNFARLTAKDANLTNRLTQDHIAALMGSMSENDWRFVQGMWDMVNSYWPALAEVSKRRTGVTPKKVETKLMFDAPAFVVGGYYPIKYDSELSAAAAQDEASGWDKLTSAGHGATAAIRNGMTKQRQKSGGGRTLKLDLSVAFAHMRDTVRYIALSESVDNSYRIISHPDVTNAFLNAGQKDAHTVLKLWLKDVASGPAPSPDAVNTAARIIKNNFTLSRLAFNFKTVALQVTGVGQSAATIGKMNMIRGYQEYLRNPAGTAAAVVDKSSFMAERRSTFQKDIYDFANDVEIASPIASGYKKAKGAIAKAGFAPIVMTQFWAVDMPTWLGAFRSGIDKYNGDEAKAITFADRMVARSQDSGLPADRSAFERGTVSESVRQADFIRLFTTLGGYMLTKMNRAYITSMQAKMGWKDADSGAQKVAVATHAATDLMLLYLTEAILVGLIYALMADDPDDDDMKKLLMRETGSAIVGGIPFIRDGASAFNGYGGGGVYGSVMEAPANFFVQAAQGENDRALRRSIADVIGTITGLPTTGPMRAIEGALDDDIPLSEMIFGRNPLNR
jgi:hypothetical protein